MHSTRIVQHGPVKGSYWDVSACRWMPGGEPHLDIRTMLAAHAALLRELRLAPELGRRRPARRTRGHLHLVLNLL
ncbi:MAG: hypothetical protein NVS3B26_28220 [Mycobacteriales bacterium]